MAAPIPTPRTTPPGIPLRDGHPTLITLGTDPDIDFWEKTVQPPGVDGGDPVDATTMHNNTWRVQRPRTLITLTEVTSTVAYDPVIYTQALSVINVETTVTITFGDGSTVAFYGYLKQIEMQDAEEGEQPEAEVTIIPTNWDPTNNTEEGPAVSSVGSV